MGCCCINQGPVITIKFRKNRFFLLFILQNLSTSLFKKGEELCESTEITTLSQDKLPDFQENYSGFIDSHYREIAKAVSEQSNKPVISFAISNDRESCPSAPFGEIKNLGDSVNKVASSIYPSYRDNDINVVLSSGSTVINFEFSDPRSWQGSFLKDDDIKPSRKIAETIAKMNKAKTLNELFEASGRDIGTIRAYKKLDEKLFAYSQEK